MQLTAVPPIGEGFPSTSIVKKLRGGDAAASFSRSSVARPKAENQGVIMESAFEAHQPSALEGSSIKACT